MSAGVNKRQSRGYRIHQWHLRLGGGGRTGRWIQYRKRVKFALPAPLPNQARVVHHPTHDPNWLGRRQARIDPIRVGADFRYSNRTLENVRVRRLVREEWLRRGRPGWQGHPMGDFLDEPAFCSSIHAAKYDLDYYRYRRAYDLRQSQAEWVAIKAWLLDISAEQYERDMQRRRDRQKREEEMEAYSWPNNIGPHGWKAHAEWLASLPKSDPVDYEGHTTYESWKAAQARKERPS